MFVFMNLKYSFLNHIKWYIHTCTVQKWKNFTNTNWKKMMDEQILWKWGLKKKYEHHIKCYIYTVQCKNVRKSYY